MPLYNTKCKECNKADTCSHPMSQDHPPCGECGGERETVILSAPKVIMKGGGWAYKEIREERQEEKALR